MAGILIGRAARKVQKRQDDLKLEAENKTLAGKIMLLRDEAQKQGLFMCIRWMSGKAESVRERNTKLKKEYLRMKVRTSPNIVVGDPKKPKE